MSRDFWKNILFFSAAQQKTQKSAKNYFSFFFKYFKNHVCLYDNDSYFLPFYDSFVRKKQKNILIRIPVALLFLDIAAKLSSNSIFLF